MDFEKPHLRPAGMALRALDPQKSPTTKKAEEESATTDYQNCLCPYVFSSLVLIFG